MEKSYKKESETLKKLLISHLAYFEKNFEWADYSNWLIRLAQILGENQTPLIPEKQLLAKRLAQCLNSSLPAKVHGEALIAYDKLFINIKLLRAASNNNHKYVKQISSEISLYAFGLFPFFQFAPLQTKMQFLKLIQDHLVELGVQLIPCLPALIACVMPGIEVTNEDVQRMTIKLLDSLQEGVGRKYFYSAIWMDILRVPRIRPVCFKYLSKKTKPFKLIQSENESQSSQTEESTESLKVKEDIGIENQLDEQHEQEKQIGQLSQSGENNLVDEIRIKSDSEYSIGSESQNSSSTDKELKGSINIIIEHDHFNNPLEQLQNQLLKAINGVKDVVSEESLYPNKSSLIVNALLSVLQDENQLARRAGLDYIISHFPINETNLEESEKQLLVEQCLYLLHLNEYNIMRRINTWLFGPPDMDNKFTLSQDQHGINVLNFIVHGIKNLFISPPADKMIPLKVVQTFYREHDHFIKPTLEQIAYPMVKFMNENKSDSVLVVSIERLLQSISNHINLVLNSLGKKLSKSMEEDEEEKTIEASELIQFTLSIQQQDSQKQDSQQPTDSQEIGESIQPIIQAILDYFVKIGPERVCEKKYRVIVLNLAQKLLTELQAKGKDTIPQMNDAQIKTISSFNDYFCEYVNLILHTNDDYLILDSTTKLLIKLNLMLHTDKIDQKLKQSALDNIKLKKELSDKVDDKQQEVNSDQQQLEIPSESSVPAWLTNLLLCLAAEAPTKIQYFSVKNIYELIEQQNFFRVFLVSNRNTLQTILRCLYYLLDSETLSAQEIIIRLQHFNNYFPEIFNAFIHKDLEISLTLEQAIRRYSKFFGLTNFQPNGNHQKSNGVGVNEMITYLSDENPLIRYASRNWLTENAGYLFRILDPLLFELLEEYDYGQFQVGMNKRVVFKRTFNADKVQSVYKQLKPLASILRERFIGYCFQQQLSHQLKEKLLGIKNLQSHFDFETTSYGEILIFTSLKLLQGELDIQSSCSSPSKNMLSSSNSNSSSSEFLTKSGSINANFCDFLESIITEISSDSELIKATSFVMENVLICLGNFIERKNQVMQVQVLNLFNILLDKVADRIKTLPNDHLFFLTEILTSQVCFPVLLLGLTSASAQYVRSTYLNTINTTVMYSSIISQQIPHTANQTFQYSNPKNITKTQNSSNQKNVIPDKKFKSQQLLAQYVEDIINTYVQLLKQTQHQEEDGVITQVSQLRTTTRDLRNIQAQYTKSRVLDKSVLLEIESATLPSSMQDQTTLFDALNRLINIFLTFKKPQEDPALPVEQSRLISLFSFSSSQNLPKAPILAQFGKFENINRSILDNFSNVLEAFLHCWPLSSNFASYIHLSSNGLPRYNYESFVKFTREFSQEASKDQKEKTLREQIINVVKPLVELFKVDMIHALFKVYVKNVNNDWPEAREGDDQEENDENKDEDNFKVKTLSKLFDLMISLELRLDEIIGIMLRSQLVLNVSNFYGSRIQIPNNSFPFNRTIAIHEINVLSFAYILFSIYPIDDAKVQMSYLLDIWKPANRFFQQFKETKHAQSLLWLIECILMMTQKFSPNEAMVERSFRKELRRLCKGILQTLSQIAANKVQFSSVALSASSPSSSEQAKRLSQTADYSLIGPLSPSIYQLYQENPNFLGISSQNMQLSCDNLGMEFDSFCLSNQILCYKVLSSVSYELLQNIYSDSNRITKITQEFLIELFKVIEYKNRQKNPLHSLNATQVIHSLLNFSGQVLVKELRKNILEIFNGQEFLKWDNQNLRYWRDIINRVSDQGDLFKEFLTNLDMIPNQISLIYDNNLIKRDGLFQNLVSKLYEQSHKVKKLFRVCFIIYAGSVDKYAKKLLDILEALNEVILNYDDSSAPGLFILILFCFRILILRMSKSTLSDQFRVVWPTILAFLMNIFNKKKRQNRLLNPNLVLSALKFIELLSIVQLEEFYFYEWMFAFDFLGVNLELVKISTSEIKGEAKGINYAGTVVTPFIYSPVLSGFFSEPYQLDYLNKLTDEDKQTTLNKEKRRIVISESTIESEQQLQSKVLDLAQYLIDINQKRMVVDMEQLEQTIEQDFIELNAFILDLK